MKGIFVWRVPEGEKEKFVEHWKRNSRFLQSYPGAQGTKLHRSLTEPGTFMAIARWESKGARDEARRRVDTEHPERESSYPGSELIFRGEFDEPFDEVMPSA